MKAREGSVCFVDTFVQCSLFTISVELWKRKGFWSKSVNLPLGPI